LVADPSLVGSNFRHICKLVRHSVQAERIPVSLRRKLSTPLSTLRSTVVYPYYQQSREDTAKGRWRDEMSVSPKFSGDYVYTNHEWNQSVAWASPVFSPLFSVLILGYHSPFSNHGLYSHFCPSHYQSHTRTHSRTFRVKTTSYLVPIACPPHCKTTLVAHRRHTPQPRN
jgi:hypothetical protein